MSNRLALETSPYLRQHADNPVDWWPWCDEALATARRERKPILLSIGYAACHWCHVMAHESFEDEATATLMNALYVNIKVDREERPDIDKVYQLAHQALARRGGGWPLTMFLTADDLVPFYAGTYFPTTPRYGMPAFTQVLRAVRAWHDDKPHELRAQNDALAHFLNEYGHDAAHAGVLDDAPLRGALARIARGFDPDNGGHLGGPKFPHATEITWLLSQGGEARAMARRTLACMADRGLADHLGGGFFRYCVDDRWEIPHFEKMLYDNAQLLPQYACAARLFGEPGFAQTAEACAHWLERELQAPMGGFMSSYDADSEGEEGRYYVWQRDEVRALLSDDEFALVEPLYGLDQPANFEGHAWHLVVKRPLDALAATLGIGVDEAAARRASAEAKLLTVRERRVRPGLDDKILTAWNALAIAGAARAARAMAASPLLAATERALDFLRANVWIDGRLYACHAGGRARFPAYLDDHAFLLDALLAMLQVRWRARDLAWAIELADALLERFEDRANGGFWFTAHDAEPLPQRPKPFVDESLPAGNGVAARALLALGHLVGESRWLDAAERCLRAAWPMLTESPQACCSLLLALGDALEARTILVLRADDDEAQRWEAAIAHADAAGIDRWRIPSGAKLPGTLGAQTHSSGGVAYLCKGSACLPPIDAPAELIARLA
ncbi:MAG: thioredoxin domain-containing protein [Dokdonella sp.]|uniref:thioredoxin domain-containing protein n=1 Tax=Dokdonella sp. TaxID=2291710 RepID=UPI003F80B655